MLFNVIFWILAIWFVINVIWMWFQLNNQILQKTFAWINVCAIIIGFWVYYGVSHDASAINGWFIGLTLRSPLFNSTLVTAQMTIVLLTLQSSTIDFFELSYF